jgi:hypothetical protein
MCPYRKTAAKQPDNILTPARLVREVGGSVGRVSGNFQFVGERQALFRKEFGQIAGLILLVSNARKTVAKWPWSS